MRRKNDAYYTPQRMTEILFTDYIISPRSPILEPCVGDGAIVSGLVRSGEFDQYKPEVVSNDIDPDAMAMFCEDATNPDASFWKARDWGWIVTNPPFSVAPAIVRNARNSMSYSRDTEMRGVAMLLRLSFLEPCRNRFDILDSDDNDNDLYIPLTKIIIFGQPRPSFTGNGRTDSVTTAWFIWQVGGDYDDDNVRIIYETGWND